MQKDIDPVYLFEQGLSPTFPERFWKRVFITPTHWLWDGLRRAPMNHGNIWRGVKNDRGTYAGQIYAHVASWILNVGPIPESMLVLHKCPGRHIPFCVNPEHLALGTFKENSQDTLKQKTCYFSTAPFKGEKNYAAKLTWLKVGEIRAKYATGKYSQPQLAREYLVTQSTVWQVIHNLKWRINNS